MMFVPFAFPGLVNVGCLFGTCMLPIRRGASAGVAPEAANPRNTEACANRRRLRDMAGFSSWHEVHQVHGTQIVFDPEAMDIDSAPDTQADGLATARPGQGLVIKTADCQPVFLAHTSGQYIAALHIGWRGCAARFALEGVRAFCRQYGLRPEDIVAVRGPSLSPAHSEFSNFSAEFGTEFKQYYDSRTRTVDMWCLTREQLRTAGIEEKNIFSLDLCTKSLPRLFFSHRYNKSPARQANIIWIQQAHPVGL